MKIFVSAYACEPNLGSEIGVGWHWVLEMSKYFELWVLTRESNRKNIEPWITEHPEYSGIHWLYYDLPKWARWWKKGLRGVRTYYNIWQWMTNGIVKRTMQKEGIHVFHHLTYGNALWKVSSYGQKQTFIWGPIGGLETIPKEFTRNYPCKWRLLEFWRRVVATYFPLSHSFKKRCANADLILCKTEITRSKIPESYRNKSILMTDVAIEKKYPKSQLFKKEEEEISFLCVGRLQPWRGFDICIESFYIAHKTNPNIHLNIIGGGSYICELQKKTKFLGLSNAVSFLGTVSKDEYERYLALSDVILNPALKEGGVTFSFDALSMGKPIICLDTSGYTCHFDNSHSYVIKIESREQTIIKCAEAICKLTDENRRTEYGLKAIEKASLFTWENHGKEIAALFNKWIPKSLQ